ncbi:LytTr DNA-binding domain-containing protein [Segatella bryantii]|uniref:LytR/AlgR family response regulator transcription factor n=1 Tax=Segatella bryantii TaxID=77095 RepID=UPI0008971ED4|nr:LytTR family DNA-binding domain-containing protein [Segatella bryantii]SEA08335.1 LytTr DNA-binding domain-containing protein [Segatella bryantii]
MNKKYVNGSAYNSEHVFVMIEWGYKRVCIHDILYLEAQQDCCNIYLLKDNKVGKIMVTIPLCEVLEDLDIEHFMRIHRSYAVNIEHINMIAGNMVRMDNGREFTISRGYKDSIDELFVFIGSRKRVKEKRKKADS